MHAKQKGALRIFHQNVQGLASKVENDLRHNKDLDTYDIITLDETWLTESTTLASLDRSGYDLFRSDRQNQRGGGILVYSRTNLKATRMTVIEQSTNIECVIVRLKTGKNQSAVVISAYRPPSAPAAWLTELKNLLSRVKRSSTHIILAGDFNVDILNVEKRRSVTSILTPLGLKIKSTFATRIATRRIAGQSRTTKTCLDFIASTLECTEYSLAPFPAVKSDHLPITAKLITAGNKPDDHYSTRRATRRINEANVSEYLATRELELRNINADTDIETAVERLSKILMDCLDHIAPLRRKKSCFKAKSAPWESERLRRCKKARHKARSKMINNPSAANIDRWMSKKRLEKQAENKAIRDYGDKIDGSGDARKTFQLLNQVTLTTKKAPTRTLKVDPDALNEAMASTVTKPPNAVYNHSRYRRTTPETKFSFSPVTEYDIVKELKKLKMDKASGPDDIPPRLLKYAANQIAHAVTSIINAAFSNSTYPKRWKLSNITAIHKKGSLTELLNYRPISLLCILGKLQDGLAADQMSKFLEENQILPKEQFAFRKNSGTETALIKLVDDVSKQSNDKKITGIIALDLSKAFDTVPHCGLIGFAESFCEPTACSFLESYLTDRRQRVVANGRTTEWKEISSGVPQGDKWSPLLFAGYTATLPSILERCKAVIYADDCNLYYSGDTVDEVLRALVHDYRLVVAWCQDMSLIINPSKTEFLLIRGRKRNIPLQTLNLGGVTINETDCIKFLGFMLNNKLDFKHQHEYIKKRVNHKLHALQNARPKLTTALQVKYYKAMILSIIEYCSIVTEMIGTRTELDQLEGLQTRAARLIRYGNQFPQRNNRPLTGISEQCKTDLGLQHLQARRTSRILSHGCKALADEVHPALSEILTPVNSTETSRHLKGTYLKTFQRAAALP